VTFARKIAHHKAGKKIYFKTEDVKQFILNPENRVSTREEIEAEAEKILAVKN